MFSILTAATFAISAATAATPVHVFAPDAFLTGWLVIGPFPNGASADRQEAFQNAHDTDYLGVQLDGRALAPSEREPRDWQGQTTPWLRSRHQRTWST